MPRNTNMNESHTAKYLILLGPQSAPRALLFGGECQYLAEMIDEDGLMVENLLRAATECSLPVSLGAVASDALAQTTGGAMQCFALG
jgi:hypothetical protein